MEYWSVGMLGLNASLHYSTIPSLHSLGGKSLLQAAQKDPEARRAWNVIVSVNVIVKSPRARNTPHEHEFERGDRAQRSIWIFFSSLPRRALPSPTSARSGRRRCSPP